MTPDKVRVGIYISKEARDKLGKNPSKAVEELAVNKFETVEDMKKVFGLFRDELHEYNNRLTAIEEFIESMSGGAD